MCNQQTNKGVDWRGQWKKSSPKRHKMRLWKRGQGTGGTNRIVITRYRNKEINTVYSNDIKHK